MMVTETPEAERVGCPFLYRMNEEGWKEGWKERKKERKNGIRTWQWQWECVGQQCPLIP
jgi:hypothetical protein